MVDDPTCAVGPDGGELRQLVERVVVGGGPDGGLEVGPRPLVDIGRDGGRVHPRVVDIDRAHRRVLGHPRPVRVDGGVDGVRGLVRVEAARPRGDDEAGGEALEVPFPRPRWVSSKSFMSNSEVPLGRGEQPEVGEMRVAGELDREAARRGRRQVRGHRQRRSRKNVNGETAMRP